MSHNYETPVTLAETSISHIHEKLDRATVRLGRNALRYTHEEYFRHLLLKLPSTLKDSVRSLVMTAYPNYEDNKYMTQEAAATEQGLVIGMRIAKLTLKRSQYLRYCQQMETSLVIMERLDGKGVYDLGQALEFTGAKAISGIAHNVPRSLISYNPGGQTDRDLNILYANAMGYSVAQAETMLCEAEIRANQPLEYAAWKNIELDIGYLGDLALSDIAASIAPANEIL